MSLKGMAAVAAEGAIRNRHLAVRRAWASTRHFRPVLFLVVGLVIALSLVEPDFLTTQNVKNILTSVAALWVVSMAMTLVLISGGFDLSPGAVAAIAGIFLAKILALGLPGGLAVVLTLLFGALLGGGINGLLVGKLGLSVFVVTLASMIGITGAVNLWSATQSFFVTAPIVAKIGGAGELAGLPTAVWIMLATLLLGLYIQRLTYFGRDVYAIGGSITAARLSGIHVPRTLIAVYGISGLCAALAGIILVGRIGAAIPQADNDLPLQAIAAVLLGGTRLLGGSGGVGGTALGVLFLGILANGLSIAGVPTFWQQVATGVILVVAVLYDPLGPGRRVLRYALAPRGSGRRTG